MIAKREAADMLVMVFDLDIAINCYLGTLKNAVHRPPASRFIKEIESILQGKQPARRQRAWRRRPSAAAQSARCTRTTHMTRTRTAGRKTIAPNRTPAMLENTHNWS